MNLQKKKTYTYLFSAMAGMTQDFVRIWSVLCCLSQWEHKIAENFGLGFEGLSGMKLG
jgi:hypothetical protein